MRFMIEKSTFVITFLQSALVKKKKKKKRKNKTKQNADADTASMNPNAALY